MGVVGGKRVFVILVFWIVVSVDDLNFLVEVFFSLWKFWGFLG